MDDPWRGTKEKIERKIRDQKEPFLWQVEKVITIETAWWGKFTTTLMNRRGACACADHTGNKNIFQCSL